MKNLIYISVITCLLIFVLFGFFGTNYQALAYNFFEDSGLKETAEQTGHIDKGADTSSRQAKQEIFKKIGQVIGVILSFVGIAFLGLTIYGGYRWMTTRGNEAEVQKAQSIIEQAVIGLIIILVAYAITAFVGNQLISSI